MVDMECVTYIVDGINKNVNTPYLMHNKALADECFPEIKKRIPGIQVIKCDIRQWFVVTEQAQKKVVAQLNSEIDILRGRASELSKVVESIN